MAVISTDTDARYWKVIDVDPTPNGTFDVLLKQVADYQGNPLPMLPAPHRTVNRPQAPALGTIVKVTDVTTVDRTFAVNPTS